MSTLWLVQNSKHQWRQLLKLIVVCKSTNVDAIDSFTNELVERKTLKWEIYKRKLLDRQQIQESPVQLMQVAKYAIKELENVSNLDFDIDLKNLTRKQIDQLVLSALVEENTKILNQLLDGCVSNQKIPSDLVVEQIFAFLCKSGDLRRLNELVDYLEQIRPKLYQQNEKYNLYRGWCVWTRGNHDSALKQLKISYENGSSIIQETVRNVLQILVQETIKDKSEAVVVAVTQVAKDLLDVHQDPFVIACLWRHCFMSTWFCDQQLASKLFNEYEKLRKIIGKKTSILCYKSLQDHNLDAVHRLIELFLRYDMKYELKICLGLLFEYQYWCKNLRACSEIIRNSADLNIPLADSYNHKLLNLLLGYPLQSESQEKSKDSLPPRFELKF